ncbi:MAG: phosphoadenylyl-sulfate reductase [Bacteroidetes bacterium]|nr:phosphoadenylyl-sulfate reductase [Bacteroidota bacterium]
MKQNIAEIKKEIMGSAPEEMLMLLEKRFSGKVAFSTSLGVEDQVLTHMIAKAGLPVKIFTLDTGRLFQESYDLMDITWKKYRIDIEIYFPDALDVEKMVNEKGINLFYESMDNRKQCCYIRKVEPLTRALTGMDLWISGLRHEQSQNRSRLEFVEWDEVHKILKVYPLLDWTKDQVWEYIRIYKIPYNTLHDKGFASIGCLPCTRAILPGEEERAGRWWWEQNDTKECGLHETKRT